jgi:hypothetical protein
MKFGHNLPRNQVPEWADFYINYKGLKKLIKNAADASKDGSAPDLAGKSQSLWGHGVSRSLHVADSCAYIALLTSSKARRAPPT